MSEITCISARRAYKLLFLLSALSGCAAGNEKWPSISFGPEIKAIEAAHAGEGSATLAPLPALSSEQGKGGESPEAFFEKVRLGFIDLLDELDEAKKIYLKEKDRFANASEKKPADWLGAQMALSNVSQLVEEIPVIRAQISSLSSTIDDLPTASLLADAAEVELEVRKFLRAEKAYLGQGGQF